MSKCVFVIDSYAYSPWKQQKRSICTVATAGSEQKHFICHQRLYYNRMTQEWSKVRISYVGSDHQTPGPREESPESDADDLYTAQYSPLRFEIKVV